MEEYNRRVELLYHKKAHEHEHEEHGSEEEEEGEGHHDVHQNID